MGRTLEQLINSYRTDPESDFLKLKYQVRKNHDAELTRLIAGHGGTQLRYVQFRTVMDWYRDAIADGKIAKARSLVSRLRELFRFGYWYLEDSDCQRLFVALRKLQLDMSPPRRVEMTAGHARAICKTAREHFGWHSIALAQALQFELLLGQKDVIGEWVPLDEPGESEVLRDGQKWLRGLRWSDVDKNLILRHEVGSGSRRIEVDLRTAPMVLEELSILLSYRPDGRTMEELLGDMREMLETSIADKRSDVSAPEPLTLDQLIGALPNGGPLIICDTNGMPWSTPEFRRKWRLVAKKAGVSDNITNRDSLPTGMIRGGPDRAKISQKYTLKRLDYSLRMARRTSEGSLG
ncbi:MAG: hypothetical protein ACREEK_11335 [Bradyrhizobium sp.]